LSGRAGPSRNVLQWTSSAVDESGNVIKSLAGYGLLRSESAEGPFDSVSKDPIRVRHFVDTRVESGVTYYYKVRAYGVEGGQSALSSAVAVTAENIVFRGLRTYKLEASPASLTRLSVLRDPMTSAPAQVIFQQQQFPVQLGYAHEDHRWQLRKSLIVDMSYDRYRAFRKRAELLLSAEAGDWTQLREKISSDAAAVLGLASPLVEPVIVLLNGRHARFRYDIEDLDSKFRKRVRLDRVGLLCRLVGDDHWRADWDPRGVRVGKTGDVIALNHLIGQLNRLHPGEIEDLFTRYVYLDRFVDRMAFAALRGELDLPVRSMYLLKDSRNGKWEVLRQHHQSGDWGIRDWSSTVHVPRGDEIDRILFPLGQRAGVAERAEWLVLYTRFFHSKYLRTKYLTRVKEMLTTDFPAAKLDEVVDSAFEKIRESVLDEEALWPFDGGKSFLEGPAKIKAAHRLRVAGLEQAIESALSKDEEPLIISRYLPKPKTGEPWIELRNRSTRPVPLSKYRLSEAFHSNGRVIATKTFIAPGKTFRAQLPPERRGFGRGPGGVFVLSRQLTPGRFEVADFVFYGHQTAGLAYGRDDAAPSGWRFFSEEALDDAAGADDRKAPTPYYRSLIRVASSGDQTIVFQTRGERSDGAAKIDSVALHYRPAGTEDFEVVPMRWEDKRFEHFVVLQKTPDRPRTEYYFVATSQSGVERAYPLGAPAITLALPVLPKLKINEICPRPAAPPDGHGEFIEIHNPSDEPVSLQGLHLSDDRRRPTKWRITENIVLKSKGYAVFFADGLNRGRHTSFKLANSGEFIGLYGRAEEGSLRIDAAAFRGVPLGHSWGSKQDGTRSFRVWKDPTPGARNLPKIPKELLEKARAKREREKREEKERGESERD
jgi:hypothetical protein